MLTSLASGAAGALDDDPLTSPTFSRPAADSRSYRRSNGQAGADGSAARADDPPTAAGYGGNGHPNGGHPSGGYANGGQVNGGPSRRAQVNGAHHDPAYADPGYVYAPDAPAAPPAVVTQPVPASQPAGAAHPGEWYSAPTHAPAQGNPYGSYVEPAPAAGYPSAPPMGYQDRQPGPGPSGYSGAHRGYQEPAYDPAQTVRYPQPAGNGASGPAGHPAGAGQFPQPGGYPEDGYAEDGGYGNGYTGQAPYADSYGAPTTRYVPGYPADGHPADEYGQDGYGGYPPGQG